MLVQVLLTILATTEADVAHVKAAILEQHTACGADAACRQRVMQIGSEKLQLVTAKLKAAKETEKEAERQKAEALKAESVEKQVSAPSEATGEGCEVKLKNALLDLSIAEEDFNAADDELRDCLHGSPDTTRLQEQNDRLRSQVAELQRQLQAKSPAKKLKKTSSEGFGKVKWGMSPKQVRKRYRLRKDGDLYVRKAKVGGLSAVMYFGFSSGKLTEAGYLITETYRNKNIYIDRYRDIRDLLVAKYGDPERAEVLWKNPAYQSMPEHAGYAISQGHTVLEARWSTGKTNIALDMNGVNGNITFAARYFSAELLDLRNQVAQATQLEGL